MSKEFEDYLKKNLIVTDSVNGGDKLKVDAILDAGGSAINTYQQLATSANTPAIASATTAITANSSRESFLIQNLGTNVLYVLMGAGASTTVFHFALQPGASNDDGNGGSVYSNEWSGIVSIAGTSPRYTVTELTR